MNKLFIKYVLIFLAVILTTSACKRSEDVEKLPLSTIAKGGDISWLPQMEASGYIFYNDNGEPEDCFKILKDHGINSVRLRTWVNPSDNPQSGHCSKEETVAMAKRAKEWGMKVMINFHYSDSWADPGKQNKPKDWEGLNFEELKQALYDYTYDVINDLKKEGISPEWVQLGNEIPSGMIHPEGHTDNWPQLVELLNKGYDAVKAVSPSSKIILHVDQGNNNERFRWWFDNAEEHGAKYDIIGMSFYPWWLEGKPDYRDVIDDLAENLKGMVLVLDARREPNEDDIAMIEYGRSTHLNIIVACTKTDKISRGKFLSNAQKIANTLKLPVKALIPVDSLKKTGIDNIWNAINEMI